MGVQVRLVLYARDSTHAEQAVRAAFRRVGELDSILSDYRLDSELNRLNAAAGGAPLSVSPELFLVLQRARRLAELSGGAFDPTVGPVVRLWREARRANRLPDTARLRESRELVGWHMIRLDARNRTAQLLAPGMRLDLGGIAKGYAGDEAIATLERHGITRALVELGGDIVAGDAPPGERGWLIRVERADAEHETLRLANQAVSTSGDTEQFVEIDGVRYSHIADPRTGVGLTDRIAVTVLAPDGITSDGLSTALSVLGAEEGTALVRRHFPKARVYIRHADGSGHDL